MAKLKKVVWTETAIKNVNAITEWLNAKFSSREVSKFRLLLKDFESLVVQFPDMFVKSKIKKSVYRSVMHKNLSIYYLINNQTVVVISVLDNRQENKDF